MNTAAVSVMLEAIKTSFFTVSPCSLYVFAHYTLPLLHSHTTSPHSHYTFSPLTYTKYPLPSLSPLTHTTHSLQQVLTVDFSPATEEIETSQKPEKLENTEINTATEHIRNVVM